MSINLDQPLTCNGQPVEVLTGWSSSEVRYCLVDYRGEVCVMDELYGSITRTERGPVVTALNSRPIEEVKP